MKGPDTMPRLAPDGSCVGWPSAWPSIAGTGGLTIWRVGDVIQICSFELPMGSWVKVYQFMDCCWGSMQAEGKARYSQWLLAVLEAVCFGEI